MQSRDFCFWLQGFFELSGEEAVISADQAAMIRRHLDMVFHHEIAPGVQARERVRPPPPIPKKTPVAPPAPTHEPDRETDRPPVVPPPTPMC